MKRTLTIIKYSLSTGEEQTIQMPGVFRVLSFQVQNGNPTIWAECDTTVAMAPQIFRMRATGTSYLSDPMDHVQEAFIGSVIIGSTAWHLYQTFNAVK